MKASTEQQAPSPPKHTPATGRSSSVFQHPKKWLSQRIASRRAHCKPHLVAKTFSGTGAPTAFNSVADSIPQVRRR